MISCVHCLNLSEYFDTFKNILKYGNNSHCGILLLSFWWFPHLLSFAFLPECHVLPCFKRCSVPGEPKWRTTLLSGIHNVTSVRGSPTSEPAVSGEDWVWLWLRHSGNSQLWQWCSSTLCDTCSSFLPHLMKTFPIQPETSPLLCKARFAKFATIHCYQNQLDMK